MEQLAQERSLAIRSETTPSIMTPEDLVQQVHTIQNIMQKVMKKDEHYGVIPGTSSKPSLLKPGAEKLAMTFRFAPEYEIERIDLGNGHREYEMTCRLKSILTGVFVGEGVGNCNTMESKYRYRSEPTGKPVPSKYWDTRDKSLLGGDRFTAKKKEGRWVICEQVEYENPADYYNTVKKMAKKRAYVDAILTATAASDIFTQDVEDMPSDDTVQPPQDESSSGSSPSSPGPATEKQKWFLWSLLKKNIDGISKDEAGHFYKIMLPDNPTTKDVSDMIGRIQDDWDSVLDEYMQKAKNEDEK